MFLTKAPRSLQLNNLVHCHNSITKPFLTHNRTISQSINTLASGHIDEPKKKLSQLFSDRTESGFSKRLMRDERGVYKELSPSMIEFSSYLYEQGYFESDSSVFQNKGFDAACLGNVYGRNFLRHATEKFGCKNQEIAKWLSGSELKRVALFGCPSLSRKAVFSAKRLRTFFKIQENTVCSQCVLKQSCKYVNQNVWNSNTKNLYLPAVMNVISHYAMESVHPQLLVHDEIKIIVARLLKVVVKLSQTVSQD
ncbi:hypothetical protein ACET3Z_020501 [Daucus carota]